MRRRHLMPLLLLPLLFGTACSTDAPKDPTGDTAQGSLPAGDDLSGLGYL